MPSTEDNKKTYTEDHKKTMQGIAELTPAFKEFAHEVMNDLAAAKCAIHLLENPETPVQAEMFRAQAIKAIDEATKLFREVGA